MVGESWDQELGHGLAGQVWCKLRRNDEALPILFELEDRGLERHLRIWMRPEEFLPVRFADENGHEHPANVLPLAEALADAQLLGIEWIGPMVALSFIGRLRNVFHRSRSASPYWSADACSLSA